MKHRPVDKSKKSNIKCSNCTNKLDYIPCMYNHECFGFACDRYLYCRPDDYKENKE